MRHFLVNEKNSGENRREMSLMIARNRLAYPIETSGKRMNVVKIRGNSRGVFYELSKLLVETLLLLQCRYNTTTIVYYDNNELANLSGKFIDYSIINDISKDATKTIDVTINTLDGDRSYDEPFVGKLYHYYYYYYYCDITTNGSLLDCNQTEKLLGS